MRKAFWGLCLIFFCLFQVTAADVVAAPLNDILVADVPFSYGESDFAARILERTKGKRDPIGLVLTGGSARAFAHIGVLAYLEEKGIEPDFIVSNSMGSIIAILYSAGLSPEQILEVIDSADLSAYFNLTVPLGGGILDPSGFEGLITSVLGTETRIEDLPIPVMVVCEDLVTKREVRMCEGKLAKVMLASFALPVYFPPQEYNGHLLIDGGIKSLAPIDTAYEFSDTVICSTTFYDVDTLNLRSPITILNGAFDVNKRYNAAGSMRKYMDSMIWIRCAVEQFSFMAFDKANLMAEIGYESAKAEDEQLSMLYKHGPSPAVLENRDGFNDEIQDVKTGLYFFNRIEQPTPSKTLTISFDSFQGYDAPWYLKNTFDYGFSYQFHNKKLEMGVFSGLSSKTLANSTAETNFLSSAFLTYFPIPRMKLSFYASADFDNGEAFYKPTVFAAEDFIFKFYSREKLEFSFEQSLEIMRRTESGEKSEYVLAFKGFGQVPVFSSLINIKGAILNLGAFAPFQSRTYLDFRFGTRLQFKEMAGTYLDIAMLSRFAIDGGVGVPLFLQDGFYTNDSTFYDC
jgi:Predicted esterase of the alpha-beta hydrolase superfamily